MKTRIKGYVDTVIDDEEIAIQKSIALAESIPSAPKNGVEDVITKVYYTALNLGKIYVAVNAKDRVLLQGNGKNLSITKRDIEFKFIRKIPHDNGVLYGTGSNDKVLGSNSDDVIRSFGGNDVVFAGAGNDDVLVSGNYNYIDAGAGDDRVVGSNGDEMVVGGAGNDGIFTGKGNSIVEGGAGNDKIGGKDGFDVAIYNGNFEDYKIDWVRGAGDITVFKLEDTRPNSPDGTDTLYSIDVLQFVDGYFNTQEMKFYKDKYVDGVEKIKDKSNFATGCVIASTDIKDYPLDRVPPDILEYHELIVKNEYNLNEEDVLNGALCLADKVAKTSYPAKIPIIKIVNYATDTLDAIVLPSSFGANLFKSQNKITNSGHILRGCEVLETIREYEKASSSTITHIDLILDKSIKSNGSLIYNLDFFDANGKKLLFKQETKTSYRDRGTTWGFANLVDGKDDTATFYYHKENKVRFVFDEPVLIDKAFITIGCKNQTSYFRGRVSKLTTIKDSNENILFQKSGYDDNLQNEFKTYKFI